MILPEIMTDAATSVLDPGGFGFLLSNLGSDGKPLLFLGVLLAEVLIFARVWSRTLERAGRWDGLRSRLPDALWPWLAPVAAGVVAALVATGILLAVTAILVAATDAILPSRTSWASYAGAAIGAAAIASLAGYVLLLLRANPFRATLRPALAPSSGESGSDADSDLDSDLGSDAVSDVVSELDSDPDSPSASSADAAVSAPLRTPQDETLPGTSRRQFLRRGAGLALGGFSAALIGERVFGRRGSGVQRSFAGMATPEITSNADFYRVSKNLFDPNPDGDRWRLRVGGSVANEFELALPEIQAMPSQELIVTMQCISNEIGGDLIGNARWTGFPLRDLLERAQPLASARFVGFRSVDDYTESLPLDFALQDQVLLVHSMNGVPLPAGHGFPLRLLAPGKYGIKHPKWITDIALLDDEFFGYWERRGWTQEARMKTSTRIDVPAPGGIVYEGPTRIYGLAFSGDRGIERVEVSTDRGESWNDAEVRAPLSPFSWVLWHYDTDAVPDNDRFNVLARATDGEGALQPVKPAPPEPEGADGWPAVSVRVRPPPPPVSGGSAEGSDSA